MKFRVPNLRLGAAVLAAFIGAAVMVGGAAQGPSFASKVYLGSGGACVLQTGAGSPETVITGNICDFYLQTNGTAGATLFVKESGTATNTGWRAVATGITGNVALLNALNTFAAFGTHTFSSGGTGTNRILVENTTSGAGNFADVQVVAGTNIGSFRAYSQGYATSGINIADSVLFLGTGSGGLTFGANHVSGPVRFYTGGTTLRGTMTAAGVFDWDGPVDVTGASSGQTVATFTAADTANTDLVAFARAGAAVRGAIAYDSAAGAMRIGTTTSHPFIFGVNGSEVGRFSTNGHLGVGTDPGTNPLYILKSGTDFNARFQNSHGSNPFGLYINFSGASPNGTGNQFIYADDSVGVRFVVRSNGGIANYSANDVNLSDARTKAITGPAEQQRADFRRLQFVKGKYLDSKRDTDDVMVTAQQVEAVFPDLVEWFDQERGLKGVREQQLFMRGLAVIQELDAAAVEQQQQIDNLEARVATLEAKVNDLAAGRPVGATAGQFLTGQQTVMGMAILAGVVAYRRRRTAQG